MCYRVAEICGRSSNNISERSEITATAHITNPIEQKRYY